MKRVTDIMAEITAASQEQSAGIESVNHAITQMDQVNAAERGAGRAGAAAAEAWKRKAQTLAKSSGIPVGQRAGVQQPTALHPWTRPAWSHLSALVTSARSALSPRCPDKVAAPAARPTCARRGLLHTGAAGQPNTATDFASVCASSPWLPLRGCLLDQRRVLLRHLVHLRDRVIHRFDAALCSWLAAVISAMMSVTRSLGSRCPASCCPLIDQLASGLHLRHRVPDQALDLFGRARTSLRKAPHLEHHRKAAPLPPARAASTAAFNARMSSWNAIPSITPMMWRSLGRLGDRVHGLDHLGHTAPPLAATSEAPAASLIAWRAFSASA